MYRKRVDEHSPQFGVVMVTSASASRGLEDPTLGLSYHSWMEEMSKDSKAEEELGKA